MYVSLNEKFLDGFVSSHEIENLSSSAKLAHELLISGKGAGNDFHGWVKLPENYNREEFTRIKKAA